MISKRPIGFLRVGESNLLWLFTASQRWILARPWGRMSTSSECIELLEREVDGPVDEVEQEEEGREHHEKVEVWDSTDLRVSCQLNIRKCISYFYLLLSLYSYRRQGGNPKIPI